MPRRATTVKPSPWRRQSNTPLASWPVSSRSLFQWKPQLPGLRPRSAMLLPRQAHQTWPRSWCRSRAFLWAWVHWWALCLPPIHRPVQCQPKSESGHNSVYPSQTRWPHWPQNRVGWSQKVLLNVLFYRPRRPTKFRPTTCPAFARWKETCLAQRVLHHSRWARCVRGFRPWPPQKAPNHRCLQNSQEQLRLWETGPCVDLSSKG